MPKYPAVVVVVPGSLPQDQMRQVLEMAELAVLAVVAEDLAMSPAELVAPDLSCSASTCEATMPRFAIINSAGIITGFGVADDAQEFTGESWIPTGADCTAHIGDTWDGVQFVAAKVAAAPAAVHTVMPPAAFFRRFTLEEATAIRLFELTGNQALAAQLAVMRERIAGLRQVTRTHSSVQQYTAVLIGAKLLTDSRCVAITSAPITDEELAQ